MSLVTQHSLILGKMGKDISLLPLGVDIPDQEGRTKVPYVLQRWCSKFKDKSQFTDGIHLTVSCVAYPGSSSASASSSEVKFFCPGI